MAKPIGAFRDHNTAYKNYNFITAGCKMRTQIQQGLRTVENSCTGDCPVCAGRCELSLGSGVLGSACKAIMYRHDDHRQQGILVYRKRHFPSLDSPLRNHITCNKRPFGIMRLNPNLRHTALTVHVNTILKYALRPKHSVRGKSGGNFSFL